MLLPADVGGVVELEERGNRRRARRRPCAEEASMSCHLGVNATRGAHRWRLLGGEACSIWRKISVQRQGRHVSYMFLGSQWRVILMCIVIYKPWRIARHRHRTFSVLQNRAGSDIVAFGINQAESRLYMLLAVVR